MKRGLKKWASKSARGNWTIAGVCAKVVNKAVHVYMEISGLPPVVEGQSLKSGEFRKKINGINLFKRFILTVHYAYCTFLSPEVEEGTEAFDRVTNTCTIICNMIANSHFLIHTQGSPVHAHAPRSPETATCGKLLCL